MRVKSLPIKKETGLASVAQLVGLTKPNLVLISGPLQKSQPISAQTPRF